MVHTQNNSILKFGKNEKKNLLLGPEKVMFGLSWNLEANEWDLGGGRGGVCWKAEARWK